MEEWLSGKKLNYFNFFHERSEGGNQEATFRESGFHLNEVKYMEEWLSG